MEIVIDNIGYSEEYIKRLIDEDNKKGMRCPMCRGLVMGYSADMFTSDYRCIQCKCSFTIYSSELYDEMECPEDCENCLFYSECTLDEKDYDIGVSDKRYMGNDDDTRRFI